MFGVEESDENPSDPTNGGIAVITLVPKHANIEGRDRHRHRSNSKSIHLPDFRPRFAFRVREGALI
jgi:hypothetical protein